MKQPLIHFLLLMMGSSILSSFATNAQDQAHSDSSGPAFLAPYKEVWMRKEIQRIFQDKIIDPTSSASGRFPSNTPGAQDSISPEMRLRVEKAWEWSRSDKDREWWSYTAETDQCFHTQIELKEYLNFLREEKQTFSYKENRQRRFFTIINDINDKKEVTFWTKDRSSCEFNKPLYRKLSSKFSASDKETR